MDEKDLELTENMPEMKLSNYLYRNEGNLKFTNQAANWGLDTPSFSSGAVYADLDGDGDLDLITNNTDDPAFIYKNLSRERTSNHYLKLNFKGEKANTQGIGVKVLTETSHGKINREMYTSHGFQSSTPAEMVIGLGKDSVVSSLTIVWPDRRFEVLENVKADQLLTIDQKNASGKFNYDANKVPEPIFTDVTDQFEIKYQHKENKFIEFNRESLMPHMVSAEGPAIAVGDINGDGQDDFFVGGAKHQAGELYIQNNQKFEVVEVVDFKADSVVEDVLAEFVDTDKDGDLDLIVLNGGNEFSGEVAPNRPRLYLNDGKGNFTKDSTAFEGVFLNGGAMAVADYDQDGDMDIFFGARSVPWKYGINPKSYLMENNGKGHFTPKKIPELENIGLVTDASWGDLDKNGFPDLVLVGDWMNIEIFKNNKGELSRETIPESAGIWSSLVLEDMDKDGDLDIIAGNLGLNTKLEASVEHPLKMYVADFDDNKTTDQLLYHWYKGAERLFMTKDELSQQLIEIKKKFVGYQEFAEADAKEVISPQRLKKAELKVAQELRSTWYQNTSNGFKPKAFPDEAQLAPVWAMLIDDFNQDGNLDIYLGGNLYEINIQMGRYDASYGNLLLGNKKTGLVAAKPLRTGVYVDGQIRALNTLKVGEEKLILIARNNNTLQFIRVNSQVE